MHTYLNNSKCISNSIVIRLHFNNNKRCIYVVPTSKSHDNGNFIHDASKSFMCLATEQQQLPSLLQSEPNFSLLSPKKQNQPTRRQQLPTSVQEGKTWEEIDVSPKIKIKVQNTPENFKAGKTAACISLWETITTDEWILNTIRGCTIKLSQIPQQSFVPRQLLFTPEENQKISAELKRFLNCGIIEVSDGYTNDEYISNIFIRPKKDGRIRLILNLKLFNSLYVEKNHFKMESLRSALNAM